MVLKLATALTLLIVANAQNFGDRIQTRPIRPRLLSTTAPQLSSTFAPLQFSELNERPFYSFPFNIGSTVIPFGVRFGNTGAFGIPAFRSATLQPSPLPLATIETSSELPEETISPPTEPTLPISSLESTATPFIPSVAPAARFSPFISAGPYFPSPAPSFAPRLSAIPPSRFSPFESAAPLFPSPAPSFAPRLSTINPPSPFSIFESAAPFFPSPAPSFAPRLSAIPPSRFSPFESAAPLFPSPAPSFAPRLSTINSPSPFSPFESAASLFPSPAPSFAPRVSAIPPSRFSPSISAASFSPSPVPSFTPRFSAIPSSDIPFKIAPEENGPAEYHFQYDIQVPETGDFKSQDETRHYDSVKGTYSLVQPDGLLRIVEYTADDAAGFNAIVRYEDAKLGRFGPGVSSTVEPFIRK